MDDLDAQLYKLMREAETLSSDYEQTVSAGKNLRAEWEAASRLANELAVKVTKLREEAKAKEERRRLVDNEILSVRTKIEDEKANAEREARLNRVSEKLDLIINSQPYGENILEHQVIGAKKLALAGRGILGDKRGLGKSLTSLATADLLEAKKIVVVTPPDVATNFQRQIQRWTKRSTINIVGMDDVRRKFAFDLLKEADSWVLLVAYSTWRRNLTIVDEITALEPDMVIADEAHYIKSRSTKAFKGLKKLSKGRLYCASCGSTVYVERNEFSREYKHPNCCANPDVRESLKSFLPMTGTPLVNRPQDLFSLLTLVDEQRFWDERRFLSQYCLQDYDGKWKFRPGGLDSLVKQMGSFFVARTREETGVQIPPQEIIYHELEFDEKKYPNQALVRQHLKEHGVLRMSEKDEFGENEVIPMLYILQLITRKRQAEVWPDGIKIYDDNGEFLGTADAKGESFKVDFAEELIDDIVAYDGSKASAGEKDAEGKFVGDRVVIFSQFTGPLEELERRYKAKGIPVARYDGSTSPSMKERIKTDAAIYSTRNEFQVLLCHYRSGGVGLDLNAYTQMVIIDEYWNPAGMDQAFGRIDRMGQEKETTVHVLRTKNSIDTWLAALLEVKQDLADGFDSAASEISHDLVKALKEGTI